MPEHNQTQHPSYADYGGGFDFSGLANSLVNNGQMALPPQTTTRMGIIAGIDPAFPLPDADITSAGPTKLNYPAVSVFLAGDTTAIHGCSISKGYKPVLGEAVLCSVTGTEVVVLHGIAGNTTSIVNQTVTNPTSGNSGAGSTSSMPVGGVTGQAGYGNFYINYTLSSTNYLTLPTTQNTYVLPASVITQILPQTIYNVTVTANFTISNCYGTSTSIQFGVIAPNGDVLPIYTTNKATNTPSGAPQEYITSNTSVHYQIPSQTLQAGEWNKKYPYNQYAWGVVLLAANNGATGTQPNIPTITFTKGTTPNLSIMVMEHGFTNADADQGAYTAPK